MRKYFLLPVSCLLLVCIGCSKSQTQPQAENAPQQTAVSQPTTPGPAGAATATAPSLPTTNSKIDACSLLTSKEIQSVQGEPLKQTERSGSSNSGFAISQCYFALPTLSNSISLVVAERGDFAGARDPKQFWAETFHRDKESEKDRDRDKTQAREEENERGAPPEKVAGIGDEAFWTGNRVGGALYALKGNTYIRISVGGAGDQAAKIKKSKILAQMILKRL
jgi:hypothetical protein